MISYLASVAVGAVIFSTPFAASLSAADIPSDTPISTLISSAKANLASGNANEALTYFDVAISRDPNNYLTIFQRGATYLSLGNNGKASRDFDKALSIKPDFEGALMQRAKIRSRNAEWTAARQDYEKAKKGMTPEYQQLEEAATAAAQAVSAEQAGDWDNCVGQAGTAIMVASTNLALRQSRARCRLERGEVLEAISDLQHCLKLAPSSVAPHMQISSMMFYSVNDREKGIDQMKKCLRSDPDSKLCSKLLRREKNLHKALGKVESLRAKKQYTSAVKMLVPSADDPGLIADIKQEVHDSKAAGYIHEKSPNQLYNSLIELACELYTETKNKKKSAPFCIESLENYGNSLPGLLYKAQDQLDQELYDAAVSTLSTAKEHHPTAADKIEPLLHEAQVILKRSKEKDYYKVLGVSTDADELAIKRAYRRLTKKHHPDKATAQGIDRETAQKKMQEINEAYEVLSDSELRARFDRGDDPNNPQQQQGHPFHGSPFGQGPGGQQFFFQQGGGSFQFPGGGFPGGGFPF